MVKWGVVAAGATLISIPVSAMADVPPKVSPELVKFQDHIQKLTGDVALPKANATLHLGDAYYFVPAPDAKDVLTKIWGNPSASAEGVIGIVFAKGATVYDNLWGAVVTYQADGRVPDSDANTADYDSILDDLRKSEAASNAERQQQGFPAIHLVGWAQRPTYDAIRHSQIWARDLRFSDAKIDTLNYDVRLLGRFGVLSLNMVSDMGHLEQVRNAAALFGRTATFNNDNTYADFKPGVDKEAGYGLAGLVAGGVGLAVAKKVGLLAVILAFGKKLIVLVVALGAAIAGWFRKRFSRTAED